MDRARLREKGREVAWWGGAVTVTPQVSPKYVKWQNAEALRPVAAVRVCLYRYPVGITSTQRGRERCRGADSDCLPHWLFSSLSSYKDTSVHQDIVYKRPRCC